MEALVKAYSKARMIEPRMCGGFHAGKYDPESEDSLVDHGSLGRAQDLILGEIGNRTDPPALLARGQLNLAMGRCKEALPFLREASKAAPHDAGAHNDFGACLLQAGNYEEALAEFDKATEINPSLVEALFNRGLCYQKMLLIDLAHRELSPFLNEERDQTWKEEVKRRINELETPEPKPPSQVEADLRAAGEKGDRSEVGRILDRSFSSLFGYTLSVPVKTYLESASTGNVEAAGLSLDQIKLVGKAFTEEKHDSIVADAAAFLGGLTREDSTGLLEVYKEYIDARGVLASYNASGADAMDRVMRTFHERHAPIWELFSAYNLATAYYEAGKYTKAIMLLQQMLPVVEARSWPFFLARVYYQLGIDYALVGQDSLAIKYCDKALDTCRQGREPEAKALQALSLPYWHLGDLDRAAACLRKSTYHFRFVEPSAIELANNYLQIADIYRRRGLHTLAERYADEAVGFALRSGVHSFVAQSASFLAVETALDGHIKDAEHDLSVSFNALDKMSGLRLYTEPLVLTREGEVAQQKGDFQGAIEAYSRAERAASNAVGDATLLIDALRGRASAYLRIEQRQKARLDLLSAVRLIESRRSTIEDKTDREHYLDSIQDVFDQIIALDLSTAVGDTAEAFAMAEQSKARALLDEISVVTTIEEQKGRREAVARRSGRPSYAKPLSLRSVQSGLPPDLVLLEYLVTNTGTYIFALNGSDCRVVRSEAGADVLASLVNKFVSEVQEKAPLEELQVTGQILYKHLISPVEDFIRDSRYLCIVPDKSLHFLPFAALIDGRGKFVVERHRVSYAPSASVLIQCLQEGENRRPAVEEGVLAVGNPDFNRSEFSQLRPLTSAEREARTVARFYDASKSKVLTGPDATKAAIQKAMIGCDVAHLAVHCLVDGKSPWLAGLVLADERQQQDNRFPLTRQNGLLYLNDIYDIPLPATRLVVLSACQSALGQYYRGEGIVSLVHPFIADHVPTVVASLWSVESDPTADLMVEFHRLRKVKHENTADALRDAQLQMSLGDEYRHPYYWAPFIVVGCHM